MIVIFILVWIVGVAAALWFFRFKWTVRRCPESLTVIFGDPDGNGDCKCYVCGNPAYHHKSTLVRLKDLNG